MTKIIDHFSINDLFWIHFKSHLTSFGFKGLPHSIHFTIGYDGRSKDVNLHLTKNHSEPKNKPKIKILIIDKKTLEEIAPSLYLRLFIAFFEPLDIDDFKPQTNDLGYLSIKNLETSSWLERSEQILIDYFKDISRIRKKTRLKINGDVEKVFEKVIQDDSFQHEAIEKINLLDLSREFNGTIDSGAILTRKGVLYVIRINNNWYSLKEDVKYNDIFNELIDRRLMRLLVWKTKRAIIHLKNSETYLDTKIYDNPIRLKRSKKN